MRQAQLAGVHDIAASTLESLLFELQSSHLRILDQKEQMSRQRRTELREALETITAFLESRTDAADQDDLLAEARRFIDNSLALQGMRVFMVRADNFSPLYASNNTTLPQEMLRLLDESGNPVMLNFQRSFKHDQQQFTWRAIIWSENNTHLACATLYEPLQIMIVASMSLDDIRIAYDLQQTNLLNSLSRVFNTNALGSGYTFCITREGDVLSHPFLEGGENLFSHLPPDAASELLLEHSDTAEDKTMQLTIPGDARTSAGGMLIFYRYYRPLDWFLIYAAPRDSLAAMTSGLTRNMLLAALLLSPVTVIICFLFGKSLSSPLQRLKQSVLLRPTDRGASLCDQTALGELGRRRDEIGELAKDCSALCKRLTERIDRLHAELTIILEQKWAQPYCRVDQNLLLLRCNSAFAALCGVDKNEIEGRSLASLPCKEFAAEMLARDKKMFNTRIPMHFELQLPGRDLSESRQFQVFKTRIDDDVATFMTDVCSQRRLLAEDLHALQLAVLGEVTASLFMESTQLFEQAFKALPPQSDLEHAGLQELQRQMHAALELAANIRNESLSSCFLPACVTAALGLLQHTLLAQDVTVNVHSDENLELPRCPPSSVKLALCCVLLNACEALAEGDKNPKFIIIDVFSEVREGRDYAVIRVEDNGPGVALDILSHIRQPFFSTRPHREALGLGLSYCDQLAQSMGGWLEISSPPNRGALLTFFLPLRRD